MFGPLSFDESRKKSFSHDRETKCPLCTNQYNLKGELSFFCKHLFEDHRLVIEDVQNIENLHDYVNYWGNKFRTHNMEEIIPSIEVKETESTYYLLSSLLKEDKDLRHKLRLDEAMKVLEYERTDKSYIRQCLFCKLNYEGSRPDYLKHLSEQHNLQLGNPQNLVFVEELIEKISKKLSDLQCLYCGKIFPERSILKEHMRKKLHKRINPGDKEYDKYYIVNYLEVGKTWEAIQDEDDRYALPRGYDQNTDEEYSDWEDSQDDITCLFCVKKDTNINTLCLHMDGDHDFDFVEVTKSLDFYQKIKLVNYIRRQVHDKKCFFCDISCENVEEHLREEKHCKIPSVRTFDQPEYYFPTYENDAFLYYIDDVEENE
ncbi:unnamed protein product [Brassicogethes aeneus]|uniref:C2H2-type domain-containing protein n=1 Tax=Brassicogethes aeneus TaxID=1431903 RepID=A0A9P0ASL9_BRAAE|nr:unnamed protein product [Brassicogethes aeneus]